MNRRQALQVIAAAPIVLSSSVSRAEHTGVTFYKHGEHEQMARQLWANMEAHSAVWPRTFEIPLMKEVCFLFCEKLLEPIEPGWTSDRFTGWNPAASSSLYYLDQDPELIHKNVSFGVMTGPEAVINGRRCKAMSRKTRVRGRLSEEDLQGHCMGVPERLTAVHVISDESVLETMREIRNDWKGGVQTNVYAISLPPFLSPAIMPSDDFTYCRRWMIRYAKAAP